MTTTKKPPKMTGTRPDFGASGSAMWSAISAEFELEAHEMAMLRELCRITDRLDALHLVIERDGELVSGLHGLKVNPALSEARQQAIAAARIAAALRLPDGDEATGSGSLGRRQRRVGVRGVYGIVS